MKPISISLRLQRDDVSKTVAKLGNGQWARDMMHKVTYEFWQITRHNFGVSGVDRPIPWAPLSSEYIEELKEKSFGTPLIPTLLRKGTLINSIRIGNITANSGEVWTDCPYAAIHQFGGRTGRNKRAYMPARPYFPVQESIGGTDAKLTPYAQAKIDAIIDRAIENAFK